MISMRKTISLLTLIIAIVIFAISAYELFSIYSEYGKADTEYNELSQQYVNKNISAGASDSGASSLPENSWDIDFESLKDINSDIVAWISVPACGISYPIVQTDDNSKYLTKTFELNDNKSGSIFVDHDCKSDFTDFNTIIYGHNMKNGSMFGSLKKLYQDTALMEGAPYFEIILPGNIVKRYEIFSYYIDSSVSTSYVLTNTEEDDQAYLDYIMPKTIKNRGISVSTDDHIVTLATCSGSSGSKKRFFVHGVLVEGQQ